VIGPRCIYFPIDLGAGRWRPDHAPTVPIGRQGTGRETACAARFVTSNESCYAMRIHRFPAPSVWPGSCAARLRNQNGFGDCAMARNAQLFPIIIDCGHP
jgi:hypothetical protein